MTKPTMREHWHTRAIKLMRLDCSLLKLLPWDQQELSGLPGEIYTLVLKKLDELVGDACRAQERNVRAADIEIELAKSIWNFLKPWKQNETRDLFSPMKQSIGETEHVGTERTDS